MAKTKKAARKYQHDAEGRTLSQYRKHIEATYRANGLLPDGYKITGTVRKHHRPANGHNLHKTWASADACEWIYWYAYEKEVKGVQMATGNTYAEAVDDLRKNLGMRKRQLPAKPSTAPDRPAVPNAAGRTPESLTKQLRDQAVALRKKADALDLAADTLTEALAS